MHSIHQAAYRPNILQKVYPAISVQFNCRLVKLFRFYQSFKTFWKGNFGNLYPVFSICWWVNRTCQKLKKNQQNQYFFPPFHCFHESLDWVLPKSQINPNSRNSAKLCKFQRSSKSNDSQKLPEISENNGVTNILRKYVLCHFSQYEVFTYILHSGKPF